MSTYLERIEGTLRTGKSYRHNSVIIKTSDLADLIADYHVFREAFLQTRVGVPNEPN